MHWSTVENVAEILRAMDLASSRGAKLCAFSGLAVTGFHRHIAREATPELVSPAIRELQARYSKLSLGIAVGAPTFGAGAAKYNSHLLIDEDGETRAVISKQGLTEPEATFFQSGSSRPIARLQGLNCSAVICREVSDVELCAGANALNRPEESVEGGESTVAAPNGEVMFRLPRESSGLGIFNLG
jgi:predicted amidohydrolase